MAQTDLLLSGGVVLSCGLVEGPLVIGVVVHPLAKVVSKVKAPAGKAQTTSEHDCLWEHREQ